MSRRDGEVFLLGTAIRITSLSTSTVANACERGRAIAVLTVTATAKLRSRLQAMWSSSSLQFTDETHWDGVSPRWTEEDMINKDRSSASYGGRG